MQLKGKKKKKKEIYAVYGEGAVIDQRCQKGLVKFCDRDFSMDDTPQSGRPTEVDSKTLIESNHHHTMGKRADILKICQSSAENHLHH